MICENKNKNINYWETYKTHIYIDGSNYNVFLICLCVGVKVYRIKNRAIETPMITITHAPTVPPTVTDRLPEDEGNGIIEVGVSRDKNYRRYLL